ncbi:hypothetical protein AURDEDRAFT_166230 [Auricularia subglabra TFB-10046 SS5]|nr:hypothetical protein AURDEDRAFT_166230 [Auricularia subglabra TFB-10046 SS5]
MTRRKPQTALQCYRDEEVPAALPLLQGSRELAASIGSLELAFPAEYGYTGQLSALSQLLAICGNVHTLAIAGNADFEGWASQLLLMNPNGIPNLRKIVFPHICTCPPDELLRLLQMMPNLRVCERLPKTPGNERVDAADLAYFTGTIRTRGLMVTSENAELVVPLLVSRRWIVHTATFYVRPRFLYALMNYEGPYSDTVDLVDITMRCTGDESPTPLASWIARSCVSLRRLHIGATGVDMLCFLESLFAHGRFRLRELRIAYSIHDLSTGEQNVARLATLLLGMPPCLTTLRVLRISLSVQPRRHYAHLLKDLARFCIERRMVFSINGTGAERPEEVLPGPVNPVRRSCCWIS